MKTIEKWEKATNELATEFVEKYYEKEADWYWVGDIIGFPFVANDDFYDLLRMVEALRYNATYEHLCDFQQKEEEAKETGKPIRVKFKNYVKLRNGVTE